MKSNLGSQNALAVLKIKGCFKLSKSSIVPKNPEWGPFGRLPYVTSKALKNSVHRDSNPRTQKNLVTTLGNPRQSVG